MAHIALVGLDEQRLGVGRVLREGGRRGEGQDRDGQADRHLRANGMLEGAVIADLNATPPLPPYMAPDAAGPQPDYMAPEQIRGETRIVNLELTSKREQLSDIESRVAVFVRTDVARAVLVRAVAHLAATGCDIISPVHWATWAVTTSIRFIALCS